MSTDESVSAYEMVLGHVLAAACESFGRPVGPTDNFFDLGGDSVIAIELTSRLATRLAIDTDPALLIDSAVFAALAAALSSA